MVAEATDNRVLRFLCPPPKPPCRIPPQSLPCAGFCHKASPVPDSATKPPLCKGRWLRRRRRRKGCPSAVGFSAGSVCSTALLVRDSNPSVTLRVPAPFTQGSRQPLSHGYAVPAPLTQGSRQSSGRGRRVSGFSLIFPFSVLAKALVLC